MYAVIGTSAFHDTTVATGPFRSPIRAEEVAQDLLAKGWNTEVVELLPVDEIGVVVNDE